MYTAKVTSTALRNLDEMTIFYEMKSVGLGEKFLKDYYETLIRLVKSPYTHFNVSKKKRRIAFKVFQCMLIYEIKGSTIEVQVLKDLRSKPNNY